MIAAATSPTISAIAKRRVNDDRAEVAVAVPMIAPRAQELMKGEAAAFFGNSANVLMTANVEINSLHELDRAAAPAPSR
jgi:hypothetical protein